MSRIVKKHLVIPNGVKIESLNGCTSVSGKLGNLNIRLAGVSTTVNSGKLGIQLSEKQDTCMLGTAYVLIKNAINDVQNGYSAKLNMVGVGFKAGVIGKFLRVYVGLSHDVFFAIPNGVTVNVSNETEIVINGNSKSVVNQFAMSVRNIKKPEPYKGKGIFFNNETVVRKEGKKK